MKVHYTRWYLRSIGETQSINREVGAEGSVKQNRGSTNRNLIQRLYEWMRLQNKLKSKKIHVIYIVDQVSKRGKLYVLPREVLQTVKENPIKKTGRKKGLLQEVSRGHSTSGKLGRTEQFIVFKYTKITLIINQNK